MTEGVRGKLGCWAHERWRTECALQPWLRGLTGWSWRDLCNRSEQLARGDDDASRVCEWDESSKLTVARIFPEVGGRLLARCREEWPFRWGEATAVSEATPRVSVILPVGGADRRVALSAVIRSFWGQDERSLEVIVVEQGTPPNFGKETWPGVKVVAVGGTLEDGFNKSLCLNAGVRAARGDVVLLHDADVVVPAGYVSSILARMDQGYEAARPLRLVFHLDEDASRRWLEHHVWPSRVSFVQQNNPGLSTAVSRGVYEELGGHDETFVGWGGEDLEFLDRLKTRRLFRGAFAPALHLWHPPAPKKASGDRNHELLNERRSRAVPERISKLRQNREVQSAGP
ncbi:MAG TPA: glycosyltransferase [Kiritimatiellia bacterium]|nr:glycosyltransferase [Kiritimatiellia bacterium]